VVLGLNDAVDYKSFILNNPERLVIDFKKARFSANVNHLNWQDTPVLKIRQSTTNQKDVRLVLELKHKTKYQIFSLQPNGGYGHRVVIDFGEDPIKNFATTEFTQEKVPLQKAVIEKKHSNDQHHFVLAIDAGHGGEDPGAIGVRGAREKDITLAIARELDEEVTETHNIKPVMIRTGDYYVGLRQRTIKARKNQADLFVSIHADAFKDHNAHGASVFTLSPRGATSEAARWLAESENRSDLVGGVKLGGKDDVLASVLLDLSQTASSEASLRLGRAVLRNISQFSRLHSTSVQQAGFLVLKSPDIPSILVETGFISHPETEQKLKSSPYQREIAQAIIGAVNDYFRNQQHPPENSKLYYASNAPTKKMR
jgi:N-acetylmuramoyl-L-alanine amidase